MTVKKSVINICYASNLIFLNKKNWKDSDDFATENWLWKSEICDLYGQIQNRALICQRPFKVRKGTGKKVLISIQLKFGLSEKRTKFEKSHGFEKSADLL